MPPTAYFALSFSASRLRVASSTSRCARRACASSVGSAPAPNDTTAPREDVSRRRRGRFVPARRPRRRARRASWVFARRAAACGTQTRRLLCAAWSGRAAPGHPVEAFPRPPAVGSSRAGGGGGLLRASLPAREPNVERRGSVSRDVGEFLESGLDESRARPDTRPSAP